MNITFTYVIVGGGSAGCVLANKLSENPENTVLLIEAGPEDKNPMIRIPKGFAKVVGQKKFTYSFAANPGGTGEEHWEGPVQLTGCSISGVIPLIMSIGKMILVCRVGVGKPWGLFLKIWKTMSWERLIFAV